MDAKLRYELSVSLSNRANEVREDATTAPAPDRDRAAAIEEARNALITLEAHPGPDNAELLVTVGQSLGRYLRAVGSVDEAIEIYQRMLSVEHLQDPSRAQLMHEMGNAYYDRSTQCIMPQAGEPDGRHPQQDLEAALRWQTEALTLATACEDCPAILSLWVNNALGLIHGAGLRPGQAVEHFEEAHRLSRELNNQALEVEVLGNLILALVEAGRYDDARTRCRALGDVPGARTSPHSLAALGLAALTLGDYAEARQQFDLARFLAGQDPGCRSDQSFMAQLAVNAATAAQAVGAYDEAERYLLDAEKELKRGGVDPRTSAIVKANLGRMYLTLERLGEAEVQLEAVLAIREEQAGPHHPDTLLLLLDLADLARLRGHLSEARTRCKRALDGLIAARGDDHPVVARARLELASLCRDEGLCGEALGYARQAMGVLDDRLGPDHKRSVMACLQTTLIAADCRASPEGAELFDEMRSEAARRYEHLRDHLGAENVEVLRAMVYFADVSAQTPAAYAAALKRYREAEQGFLKLYGDGVLSMAALRFKQGKLLEKMGELEEGFAVYDRARRLLGRSLDAHPIRAELLTAMGDICKAQGNLDRAKPLWQQAYRILLSTYGKDHPRVREFMQRRGS